jgi:hypothetical protein
MSANDNAAVAAAATAAPADAKQPASLQSMQSHSAALQVQSCAAGHPASDSCSDDSSPTAQHAASGAKLRASHFISVRVTDPSLRARAAQGKWRVLCSDAPSCAHPLVCSVRGSSVLLPGAVQILRAARQDARLPGCDSCNPAAIATAHPGEDAALLWVARLADDALQIFQEQSARLPQQSFSHSRIGRFRSDVVFMDVVAPELKRFCVRLHGCEASCICAVLQLNVHQGS